MVGEQVGPIIFSERQPREHLLDYGKVYSFRASERTTGDTWARASRTGPKIADVTVTHEDTIQENPRETIDNWVWPRYSGYDSAADWWEAIVAVHGSPDAGHIYRVTLRGL